MAENKRRFGMQGVDLELSNIGPLSFRQQIGTMANRPIRLGFIINRNISPQTLHKVFQYNCSVWGGRLNLFVPTDGTTLSNDWWRILDAHDPDIIIYVGEATEELIHRVYTWVLPFYYTQWDDQRTDKLFEENGLGRDPHSMSIWPLFLQQLKQEGKTSPGNSNCRFPVIGDTKYRQFFEIAYGVYPATAIPDQGTFEKAFYDILGATHTPCFPSTLEEYLAILDTFDDKMTPLRFTTQLTTIASNALLPPSPTLIVTNGGIDDLFLCHVTRWSRSSVPVVFVHLEDLVSDNNVEHLSMWLGQQIRGTMLTIASCSVELETLRTLRERMRPYLPPRTGVLGQVGWYLSIQAGNFQWTILSAVNNIKQQLLHIDGQRVAFLAELSFEDTLDTVGTWVTEFDLLPHSNRRDGFKPSMFPSLNAVLSGATRLDMIVDASWHRITRGAVGTRVRLMGQILGAFLPSSERIINEIMKQAGNTSAPSPLGRYCHGIVEVVGGLEGADFIKDKYMRKLFYELSDERYYIERGLSENTDSLDEAEEGARPLKRIKANTFDEMLGLIHPPTEYKTLLAENIARLAAQGVFLRGSNLKCTNCALTTWYSLDDLAEAVTCKGCHSQFQLPIDKPINFAYQFNRLFFEGFSQGASCVLLTALLLHGLTEQSMMWQAGCTVKKQNNKDLEAEYDLVAICDGLLIVAECKASFNEHKTRAQLQRDIAFAERIHADILLFTTQQETITPEFLEFLQQEDSAHERLRVKFVSASELEEGILVVDNNTDKETIHNLFRLVKLFPPYIRGLSEADPKGRGGMMVL